jgi:hypothetical protein
MAEDKSRERSLPEKIHEWLDSNGYPLELRVAGSLHNAKYEVEQSYYYQDVDTRESREIDIIAQATRMFEHAHVKVILALTAIIECKSNPKNKRPWVVFTSRLKLAYNPKMADFSLFSNATLDALSEASEDRRLADLDFLKLGERIGYSITSPGVEKHDKGHDDLAYIAVNKLAKAAYSFYLPMKAAGGVVCYMAVPVLAVSTPLFECWLDEKGAIQLEERKEILLLWRRPVNPSSHPTSQPFLIRVVHESAIPALAENGNVFLDYLVDNLKDQFSIAVALAQQSRTRNPGTGA